MFRVNAWSLGLIGVVVAVFLVTSGPSAVAQFAAPATLASSQPADSTGLYFEIGGGVSLPFGAAYVSTAADLDDPVDKSDDSSAVKFDGSIGTALSVGIGVDVAGGLRLGVEGSFAGYNYDQKNVESGGVEYDSEATATALGGLLTGSFDIDLSDQFSISPMVGIGYFQNTASATIRETSGGVTTEKKYEEHARRGLGFAGGIGFGITVADSSSISLAYRFISPGKASTDYVSGSGDNAVIDFGTINAHQGTLQASFRF